MHAIIILMLFAQWCFFSARVSLADQGRGVPILSVIVVFVVVVVIMSIYIQCWGFFLIFKLCNSYSVWWSLVMMFCSWQCFNLLKVFSGCRRKSHSVTSCQSDELYWRDKITAVIFLYMPRTASEIETAWEKAFASHIMSETSRSSDCLLHYH